MPLFSTQTSGQLGIAPFFGQHALCLLVAFCANEQVTLQDKTSKLSMDLVDIIKSF